MLRAALNISWEDHPTKRFLYGPLPPVSTKIRERRLRFAGHCFRSKQELVSDVLLWEPKHGKRSVGAPSRTYVKQLIDDTGHLLEDLPTAMEDRNSWRSMVNSVRGAASNLANPDTEGIKLTVPTLWSQGMGIYHVRIYRGIKPSLRSNFSKPAGFFFRPDKPKSIFWFLLEGMCKCTRILQCLGSVGPLYIGPYCMNHTWGKKISPTNREWNRYQQNNYTGNQFVTFKRPKCKTVDNVWCQHRKLP